jgi:hypothetical protein
VAVGTLSLFDHALRIYHLLEPVFPVFSPIIYVITYSDGLCHPTLLVGDPDGHDTSVGYHNTTLIGIMNIADIFGNTLTALYVKPGYPIFRTDRYLKRITL